MSEQATKRQRIEFSGFFDGRTPVMQDENGEKLDWCDPTVFQPILAAVNAYARLQAENQAMREALIEVLPIIKSLDIGKESEDEDMPIITKIKEVLHVL